VHGECLSGTTARELLQGQNELVFSGLVVKVTWTAEVGYRATFEVDRVWKGVVSKYFDIYIWQLAPETGGFALNKRYVVVAKRLTESRARESVGIGGTDAVAFTQVPCTGPIELGATMWRDLGEGKPPQ
jgi:hypothetical protein